MEGERENGARVIRVFWAEAGVVAAFVAFASQVAQNTGATLSGRVVEADESQ